MCHYSQKRFQVEINCHWAAITSSVQNPMYTLIDLFMYYKSSSLKSMKTENKFKNNNVKPEKTVNRQVVFIKI